MHVEIIEVAALWPYVFFGGKSRQTLLIDKYAEWINAIHQTVDA